ncbi:MAG: acyltransferase [Candidatus Obscuribacterales bacterium]|nr:acyltransferase [Candidatus Obscuribacterales bacterium]
MLIISDKAKISSMCDIEDSLRGTHIIIEEGVCIDAFVKIKPAGGCGDVTIGRNSHINSGCVLYTGNGIKIGEDVLIAANCTFAPVNHAFRSRSEKIINQRFAPSKGGIIVEDDVWIGAGTVLLDGTHIHKGAVIGAGSVVRGVVEAYSINVGNPTVVVGFRT